MDSRAPQTSPALCPHACVPRRRTRDTPGSGHWNPPRRVPGLRLKEITASARAGPLGPPAYKVTIVRKLAAQCSPRSSLDLWGLGHRKGVRRRWGNGKPARNSGSAARMLCAGGASQSNCQYCGFRAHMLPRARLVTCPQDVLRPFRHRNVTCPFF